MTLALGGCTGHASSTGTGQHAGAGSGASSSSNTTGMTSAGGGVSAGGSSGNAGSVTMCAPGFVRCAGLCLESSVMGADCHPLACAVPTDTTPPARTSISARGFTWDVSAGDGGTTIRFTPGKAAVPLSPTSAVDVNYRVNDQPALLTGTMTDAGDGSFAFQSADLKPGDSIDFYFHQTVAAQTLIVPGPTTTPLIDTMWFHQVIGAARDPEPAYPLTVKLAGRFRDRHPNEERYDHYVDTYFAGPTFDLTLIDHGDSVDVTIAPQASMQVEAVDFKNYECFGSGMSGALPSPTPLCFTPPALAAVGVRTTDQGNSTFTTHVDQLSYGQLLDFELTFVRSRTYYTEWFQYFVGSGRLQPKVQHPWAHAAGDQSVTDVTVDEFGYAQHVPNITPEELANFISGKVLFEADFETHVGY
ncbi:MAG TPA: hypothetical protein VGM44_08860, partial [Polyangiaceae bacterium]